MNKFFSICKSLLVILGGIAVLPAFLSCSKEEPEAIDAALIEGRWKVESIRYVGHLSNGNVITGESDSCDIFWTGDIVEFKNGELFEGETGSGFYAMFDFYPGSIHYSIIDNNLYIPEQEFPAGAQDAGGGYTFTISTTVGEWSFPFTLSGDTWIIRHEQRRCFDRELLYYNADYEFVLKRVE